MSIVLSSYPEVQLSREQEHMIRLICRTDSRLPLFIVESQVPAFPAGREGVGRCAQRASGGIGGEEQLSQAVYLPGVGELLGDVGYFTAPLRPSLSPPSPLILPSPLPLSLPFSSLSQLYSHHNGQSRCVLQLHLPALANPRSCSRCLGRHWPGSSPRHDCQMPANSPAPVPPPQGLPSRRRARPLRCRQHPRRRRRSGPYLLRGCM